MFKIDFEKAYDMVDWNFLKLTLMDFGFPPQIIALIMNYTTSTILSLKWNSEKLKPFALKTGLCQGVLMSLYLFTLCMEKLSLLTQQKVNQQAWLPVKVDSNGPIISHLFFAKDYLLFTQVKSFPNQVGERGSR